MRWHIPCNPAAIPPLSGMASSSNEPGVPCPYQSTEILVLMQATPPPGVYPVVCCQLCLRLSARAIPASLAQAFLLVLHVPISIP